ncbi:VOC family protein [Actinospongicola halichondriae]|uniref:VOC family protein n=1 Tax=Actinospongicola halichondriae TaxID=3236844 RepID=UPI003D4BBCBA
MGEYGPRLGGVGIGVSDLAAATAFYCDVFGMSKLVDLELDTMDETILTAEGSHVALILMCHTDGVERDLANTGGKIVVNVADPAATIALAVEHGGAVMREPEPNEMMGGKHIGFITDPDGQVIELIEA